MTDNLIQARFDEFIFQHDDLITLPTAHRLAAELGVSFDPENYDF